MSRSGGSHWLSGPPAAPWEQGCKPGAYQNSGYWATPIGWFVYTLDLADPELADRTIGDMVRHFQQYDACEWIFSKTRVPPNYLASAALLLACIRAVVERRRRSQRSGSKQP